jgi:hypothetical protein
MSSAELDYIAKNTHKDSLLLNNGLPTVEHSVFVLVCKFVDHLWFVNSDSQRKLVIKWCLANSFTNHKESIKFILSSFCGKYGVYLSVVEELLRGELMAYERAVLLIAKYEDSDIADRNRILAEITDLSTQCQVTEAFVSHFCTRYLPTMP